MKDTLIINSKDNVGVMLDDSAALPKGHKFALKDIKKGEPIYKYGEIIGRADYGLQFVRLQHGEKDTFSPRL